MKKKSEPSMEEFFDGVAYNPEDHDLDKIVEMVSELWEDKVDTRRPMWDGVIEIYHGPSHEDENHPECYTQFSTKIGNLYTGIGGLKLFWENNPDHYMFKYNGKMLHPVQRKQLYNYVFDIESTEEE